MTQCQADCDCLVCVKEKSLIEGDRRKDLLYNIYTIYPNTENQESKLRNLSNVLSARNSPNPFLMEALRQISSPSSVAHPAKRVN